MFLDEGDYYMDDDDDYYDDDDDDYYDDDDYDDDWVQNCRPGGSLQ